MTDTENREQAPLRIALVAGEDSGDLLGAELARAWQRRYPHSQLFGVGGPRMAAAGVDCWHQVSELSVMGFGEVARHLPRLLRLRRRLTARLLRVRPDITLGIDAPDFTLGLEKRLKAAGLTTVHYVSPSVWAWREKRAARIGDCAERVLCLFPMEPAIYARHGVDARFTGHPQAARLPLEPDRAGARAALDLPADAPVLALLPGSRGSEIKRLGEVFLAAAERILARLPKLIILLPAANQAAFDSLQGMLQQRRQASTGVALVQRVRLLHGDAERALTAADAALLASGTVALEAMLAKCPMVVGYKLSPVTSTLVRSLRLMNTSVYSLPNILAGHELVPELIQSDCRPDKLAEAVLALFADDARRQQTQAQFTRLHRELVGAPDAADPAERAVAASMELLGRALPDA